MKLSLNLEQDEAIRVDRGTLFFQSSFGVGVVAIEARDIEVRIDSCAQYAHAVRVRFTPKGKRIPRQFSQGYKPDLVVLEGWGHEEPPDGMVPVETTTNFSVRVSQHTSFDDGWAKDFATWLESYVARTGARIAADFRGHCSY